jgi:hypothetical protein
MSAPVVVESLKETPRERNVYSADGQFGDTPRHWLSWSEEVDKIIIDPSFIPDGQSILVSRYAAPDDITSHVSGIFVAHAEETRDAFEIVR